MPKSFIKDLNTLQVFAYAHDEVEKLSDQLLLEAANRLPAALKRQYLDCLEQRGVDLNRPGFEKICSAGFQRNDIGLYSILF